MQKQASKWGNFGNAGTLRKPIAALQTKLSQQCRSWRLGRITSPVFEVKKEILVYILFLLAAGCSTFSPPPGLHGEADAIPPTVSLTAPNPGARVSGTVTLSATATDDLTVASVQFQLDGANLGSRVTASPFSTPWDTTENSNGSHMLIAIAKDAAGNSGTSAGVRVTVSNSTPPGNVIAEENEKPGDASWRLASPNQAIIEGFASATSVNHGENISFFVNTSASDYTVDIYRVGWYGGAGARRMMPTITRGGTQQPIPSPDPNFSLVECVWDEPYILSVPNNPADPTEWASGVYLAKLSASSSNGFGQSYIIFVVRDDSRSSELYFQASTNTYQAYNEWGKRSLYSIPRAYKVSYNRPYKYGYGTGDFLRWEYNMLRFLEREGYDVTYSTDVDTHLNPNLLLLHKAVLIVGHDEYWTWEMFSNFESARNAGVNLGFFSANDAYWQVRFEPSPATGQPDRTIVGYKEAALRIDPVANDPSKAYLTTTNFRRAPVNRPEDKLIGEMFDNSVGFSADADIAISDADESVFQGTGLDNGDMLSGLLGNEVDRVFGTLPPNEIILCHSVYTDGVTHVVSYSDVTKTTNASGGMVVALGTLRWSWGLDDDNYWSNHPVRTNAAAQQITRNILKELGATHRRTPKLSIDPMARAPLLAAVRD